MLAHQGVFFPSGFSDQGPLRVNIPLVSFMKLPVSWDSVGPSQIFNIVLNFHRSVLIEVISHQWLLPCSFLQCWSQTAEIIVVIMMIIIIISLSREMYEYFTGVSRNPWSDPYVVLHNITSWRLDMLCCDRIQSLLLLYVFFFSGYYYRVLGHLTHTKKMLWWNWKLLE